MELLFNEIMKIDEIGYQLVSSHLISDFATPIAKFITIFGSALFLIALTILLVVCIKDRKIGLCIAANLGLIGILNFLLKNIVQRPRPTEFRIVEESGYSFPSGHSMIGMAFYGFLIYLVYRYIKNPYLKWGLIVFLVILILSIGVSRIYLGVHYTTDVLAGFLASISYLIIYTSIIKKYVLK